MNLRHAAAFALLFLASASPLVAQNSGCPNVAKIKIVGNQRISTDSILSFIRSEAHQPFDAETADEDIKALYHTGNFESVKLEFEGTNDSSCILVFEVKERPAN